jgi:large subunit ribosomal protein L10
VLTLEQKKTIVAEVAEVAARAHSAVAAEYRGLSVEKLTKLRRDARQSGVYVRVVKNTLARRAVQGTEFECMQQGLVGPLVIAFSQDDPGSAARICDAFAKENEKFVIRVVAIGGKLVDPKQIKAVAALPTRSEAIAKLMATMQAPVAKFVRTVNEVPSKLVRTVAAIKDAKPAQ